MLSSSSNNSSAARAIKRVLYDLKELESNPIQGASICMPDVNDPFTLHCNILVKEGLYEGLIFHLIFHIPHDYPMSAPAINIAPGIEFNKNYHSYIYDAIPYKKTEFFEGINYGYIVCTPLTSMFSGYFRLSENEKETVKTNWLPGYSLSSLLVQLQVFFAEHDLPVGKLPTKTQMDKLKEHMSLYMLDITVNDGSKSESEVVTHTFYNPYPSLSSFKNVSEKKRNVEVKPKSLKKAEDHSNSTNSATMSESSGDIFTAIEDFCEESKEESAQSNFVSAWDQPIKKVKPGKKDQNESKCQVVVESCEKKTFYSNAEIELPENHEEISQKIICSINKIDIFDESKPIFGYPLDLRKDQSKNIWAYPVPELISQSAFQLNFRTKLLTTPKYEDYAFASASGSCYNFWLPVYINEAHFANGKKEFYNAIHILHDKIQNKKTENFSSGMVLKVLPPILVKLLAQLAKTNSSDHSRDILTAYYHFYHVLMRMIKIFPNLQKVIDNEVELFCQNEKNRSKQALADLNEFIVKFSLSSKGMNHPHVISMLFKEYMTRQVVGACKSDRGLMRTDKCPNFIKRFIDATKHSNFFFLTQLVSVRVLQSQTLKTELNSNYGCLSEPILEDFKTELLWNQDRASVDWRLMIDELKLKDEIPDGEKMMNYLLTIFKDADTKGYLLNRKK